MIGRHLQISNFLKVFHLEALNPKCRIKYFLDKKKKLQKNVKFWFFISSLVFKVLICKIQTEKKFGLTTSGFWSSVKFFFHEQQTFALRGNFDPVKWLFGITQNLFL